MTLLHPNNFSQPLHTFKMAVSVNSDDSGMEATAPVKTPTTTTMVG
jgi:hypothetical protein